MKKVLQYKNITIKNFKSIWEVKNVPLSGNIMPIVGINGAGKSNMLRALSWYYGQEDGEDEKPKHSELRNKYHSNGKEDIVVEIEYSLDQNEDRNYKRIKKVLNDIFGSELKKYYLSVGISTEEEFDDFRNNIIEQFGRKKSIRIRKTLNNENQEIYEIISKKKLDYETDADFINVQKYISGLIYERIIRDNTPKIVFFDTRKIIEEFHNNSENKVETTSLSFKNLFSWTEFANKSSKKYKIINSILNSTKSKYTFDDFKELSYASFEAPSLMNKSSQDNIVKLHEEFNEAISKNGFFKSINSNSKVNIFPSYKPDIQLKEGIFDDGEEEVQRNGISTYLKLTIFDVVKTERGDKEFIIEDISFKNDGFIFALILFLFIEYLLDDESLILIDEPANFLSDTSVKLLMENFARISNERNIKFIFTTHSHQTLRKDIVNINDIKIAKKDDRFNTIISSANNIDTNSEEFSIINYEYSEKPSGTDLIRLNSNMDKSNLKKNILFNINDQYANKTIILFANFVLGNKFNIIPSFNPSLVKANMEKFSKIKNSDESCLEDLIEYSILNNKNINIFSLFDNEEIKKQVGINELTENGAVNDYKLKDGDFDYKVELILKIFKFYNNNFNTIKSEMPNSVNSIAKEFENKYA